MMKLQPWTVCSCPGEPEQFDYTLTSIAKKGF